MNTTDRTAMVGPRRDYNYNPVKRTQNSTDSSIHGLPRGLQAIRELLIDRSVNCCFCSPTLYSRAGEIQWVLKRSSTTCHATSNSRLCNYFGIDSLRRQRVRNRPTGTGNYSPIAWLPSKTAQPNLLIGRTPRNDCGNVTGEHSPT